MPTISRKSFEEYRSLTDRTVERATKGFAKKMARAARGFMEAPDEETRAPFRQAIADEVYGRIDVGRCEVQMRADDFFEQTMGEQAAIHPPYPVEAVDARVRSAAIHLFDKSDIPRFLEVLETFIENEVHRGKQEAVWEDIEAANKVRARS